MTMCARTAITLASSALITYGGARLGQALDVDLAAEPQADSVDQRVEQLLGQRLAVGDQADDRPLGQRGAVRA